VIASILAPIAGKLALGVLGLVALGFIVWKIRQSGRDAEKVKALTGTVTAERDRAKIDDDIRRDPADDRGLRGYERD
jgi:hypothetical protein